MKQFKIDIPKGYEIDKEKSTFENIIFKKEENKYPETWEELETVTGYYINPFSRIIKKNNKYLTEEDHKNIVPKKEQAESILLLGQLLQLRDKYRDGWISGYNSYNVYVKYGYVKYGISFNGRSLVKCNSNYDPLIFVFQTAEIRDIFYDNFKNELETYFNGLI